ncbi:MAG: hypothetical protein QOE96_1312 [Blastocatellia bacterium]|nr:hypothetical protein [Blastocatellia bacterium]
MMKPDCFKLRMRLLTLVFSFAAVLLLMIPSLKPNASARTPQGKGGEVIAKPTPTPTPKKTTVKKKAPAGNSRISRPAKPPSDSATAAETIFWNSIKDSTNPDDFKEYLKKYPNGEFADLAKNRLKTIGTEQPKAPTSENTEPEYWETIRNSKDAQDFKDYLQAYPHGVHAAIAGLKIKQLEAAKTTTPANPTTTNSSSTLPRTRTNQTGIEFVLIPPGSFIMGSTNGEANENPVHRVTISQAFYMGKYEVTQAQWQSVMGNNPSFFKDCGGNCPVEQVSWDDAQNFINKLNESNDGFRYRLPTEAEWEYAGRAKTTGDRAGDVDSMAWHQFNSASTAHPNGMTHPVGEKAPNGFDLYDMLGNVMEWCEDWYDANYYASSPATDPQGPGSGSFRVLRGGSFELSTSYLRSAKRFYYSPDNRSFVFGFRVVAVVRSDSNPTSSTVSKVAIPPNPPLPLHSFDFVTVTLDGSGKLKSRETKSANAYTDDLGGGVKLEMVAIPPGEFMMGAPEKEAEVNEVPQHRVRIGYWFYMGKFEVTQVQWRAIMDTNPSYFKGCDDCPVEQVSWNDATEFCHKLSARTGREYRLPSEAEWEYAARAGTATPFAFGDTITPEIVNYDGNYPYANAVKGTYRQKTVPGGSLGVANAFGLFDMHGNVYEWCQDWSHDTYAAIAGDAPTDGSAWVTGGEQKYRVLRGGSYGLDARFARSARRVQDPPDFRLSRDLGFRVVAVR